jgi:hypothetical protein
MKRWLLRILLLAVLVGAGVWGWRILHPSAEQVIRKRFAALAQTASFSAQQSPLARLAKAAKLADFCTPDVQITVETSGRSRQTFSGRDELLAAAAGAQSMVGSLTVEFVDVSVKVSEDKQSATVNLTVKGKVSGEKDTLVQELEILLNNVKGDWLISRVETVKTLL